MDKGECVVKKIINSWLPFLIFMLSCAIMGNFRLFSKHLNPSLIALLIISVVIVKMLEHPRFK